MKKLLFLSLMILVPNFANAEGQLHCRCLKEDLVLGSAGEDNPRSECVEEICNMTPGSTVEITPDKTVTISCGGIRYFEMQGE